MEHQHKRRKDRPPVWGIGKLLSMLPACPLFFPIYRASQLFTVKEVYVSKHVPRAFDGLKIAFASDIHYGTLLGEKRVRDLAARINEMQADVVILGGDYGENSQGAIDFFHLKPGFQAKQMVLGVIGNHDLMGPEGDLPLIREAMQQDGVKPLVNDAVFLERCGKRFAIAATDDYFKGEPDLRHTAYISRNADFVLYVSHCPDILPETYRMPGGPFYQLALCGHTHGGQIAIRGHAIKSSSEYGNRFLSGWIKENGVDILVSNGVGTSGVPVRLGTKPQVHLITLRHLD